MILGTASAHSRARRRTQAWLSTGKCEDKMAPPQRSDTSVNNPGLVRVFQERGSYGLKIACLLEPPSPPRNCVEFRIRRKINLTLSYAGHFGGSLHHDKGGHADGL